MYKITRLNNGLTVITDRMVNMDSVSVGFWIKAGGRYESRKQQGISHFLEHMLFKGTKKRSYKQLKEVIEGSGGLFNAFTSEDHTCYYVKIVSNHLMRAIDVLSDMVLNPLLDKKEIDKERNVIIEELRMYMDLPNQYVYELFDDMLWPNHPLGRSLLGTEKTLSAINKKNISGYKERYYSPSNIILSACGDIEHDFVVEAIAGIFSRKKASPKATFKKVQIKQLKPDIKFYTKKTEQSHLCLGVHAFDRLHNNKYAQSILNIILGGNMSSRLFNEVREKRCLAYEIGSGIKKYVDTGSFFVHAGVDNNKVAQTVSVVMSELDKMKRKAPSAQELSRAKEYFKGRLLMSLEDTMYNMFFLAEQLVTTDKIFTKDEIISGIGKVNTDNVQEVADKIFVNKSLNMAVIGPVEDKQKAIIEGKFKF